MSRHTIIKALAALCTLITLTLAALWWAARPSPPTTPPQPDTLARAEPDTTPDRPSPAALRGTLLDHSGSPLPGATLTLADLTVTTDSQGAFAFDRIPDNADALTLTPPQGFTLPEHLTTLTLPEDTASPLSLTLQAAASLQGTLLAGGRPLSAASISVLFLDSQALTGPAEPFTIDGLARTSPQGTFTLDALLPGRIQLLIESDAHPFFQSQELTLDPAQDKTGFTLDIAPNTLLSMELLDAQGDALAGEISVTSESGQLPLQRHRTDAQGKLALQGLPADVPLTLIAHARAHRHALTTLTLDPSEPTIEQLVLDPTAQHFAGLVLDSSYQPVPNATVTLTAPGTRNKIARTDAEGRFTLDGEQSLSSMQATVLSAHHPPSAAETVTRGEERLFVLSQGGFISGQVISARGAPVTSYTLEVSDFRPESGPRYNRLTDFGKPSFSSLSGTFTLGPLRPGTYYLKATPEDLASAESAPISVSAAQTTSNITLTVQQPGRVTGVVSDASSGAALPGATIALTSTNRATLTTTTDAQGRYTLESVPPGRQSVRVTLKDYTTQFAAGVQVAPDGTTTQDVQMEKGDAQRGFSFYGIGASLDMDDEGLRIRQVMPGSPALAAGARDGDYILSVDGKSTDNMRVIDAVEIIRGQEDTDVQLDISRPGEGRLTLTVTRGKVKAAR